MIGCPKNKNAFKYQTSLKYMYIHTITLHSKNAHPCKKILEEIAEVHKRSFCTRTCNKCMPNSGDYTWTALKSKQKDFYKLLWDMNITQICKLAQKN